MADFGTDFNIQSFTLDPVTLIHEFSASEYYIGVSNNGRDTGKPTWKIRKIVKVGNVWATTLYPNGEQTFTYVWNGRLGYTYI